MSVCLFGLFDLSFFMSECMSVSFSALSGLSGLCFSLPGLSVSLVYLSVLSVRLFVFDYSKEH